jgi:type 1 fimbriae regulatory protein FimB/type 1 fimbriae regulatory protein FimE
VVDQVLVAEREPEEPLATEIDCRVNNAAGVAKIREARRHPLAQPDRLVGRAEQHRTAVRQLLKWDSATTPVAQSRLRPREYLTAKEVERLIAAAKSRRRRYGLRDATMILVAFRHGLRVSELVALTWDQIDFSTGMMHVRRGKNGMASVQQIGGEELRALRALQRDAGAGRFIFMTERGAPMTAAGFRKMLARLATTQSFRLACTRTCCGMRVATSSPTMAATPARCSTTSATRTSCTRCATPSCRRSGSRISGKIDGTNGRARLRSERFEH